MWFASKKSAKSQNNRSKSRRRRMREATPSILEIKMRRSGKSAVNWRHMAALVVSIAVVAVGALTLWLTLRIIGAALFWENNAFNIREIRVECPEVEVQRADILAFLPFRIGDNLFQTNLVATRRSMLLKLPRLKDLELSRCLPDKLLVRARERKALARLKMDGYTLALDADGCVLGYTDPISRLPLITGHGLVVVRPGAKLSGTPVASALEILDICDSTPLGQYVQVDRVDVRDEDGLDLLLRGSQQVRLAWRQMHRHSTLSREYLELKLNKLAEIKRQGRTFHSLDMTLDNNFPAQ